VYNHAPAGYDCPFCRLARGQDTSLSSQADLIYRDRHVIALVSIDWWPNNPGHVLVAPAEHFENVYELPPALGAPLQTVIRNVALAMKDAYGCTGMSIRQNNEPDGAQDVWHHHTHVIPRYKGDNMHRSRLVPNTAEERKPYVGRLRERLDWREPQDTE
jgi:histidine triad (HIT) family protein